MQQCGIKKKGKHFTLKWVRSIFRIGLAFMTSGLRKVWQKFHLTVSDSYKVFLWHLFSLKLCCCLRDLEAASGDKTKVEIVINFLVFTLLMLNLYSSLNVHGLQHFDVEENSICKLTSSQSPRWMDSGKQVHFFSLFLFVKSDTSEQKLHLEIQH